MPSQRREPVHNSNTGYRHRYREKKIFSKNKDRYNIRGKRPGFIELSPVVGCKPYSIKELRGFYDFY